jgi:hypothetical protein
MRNPTDAKSGAVDSSTDEMTGVMVHIPLTYESLSEIETFSSNLRLKSLRVHKRKAKIGMVNICTELIDLMLADKEIKRLVGERLLEKLKPKTK